MSAIVKIKIYDVPKLRKQADTVKI